jgi:hypothetical protein
VKKTPIGPGQDGVIRNRTIINPAGIYEEKKINNKSKWLSQASLVTNPASGAEAVGGSMEFCGDAKIQSL